VLTQHSEAQRSVEAEVASVLGDRAPTFDDLMAMPYTRALIQETLRLYPPAYNVPRTAAADDEIDGYRIPAGATVVALIYGVHHNPAVWDDPERFDPARFLGDAPATRHKLAWVPFGAGQRQCIGRDLSLMETQIILPLLLQRYSMTPVPGRGAQPKLASTFVPRDGVHVYLRRHGRP
jgi:cytochrome P450